MHPFMHFGDQNIGEWTRWAHQDRIEFVVELEENQGK